MEYSRKQIKVSSKNAMASARPRVWVITLAYLVIAFLIAGLFNVISPNALAPLTDPISDSMEDAIDEAAEYIMDGYDLEYAFEAFGEILGEGLEEAFEELFDDNDIDPYSDSAILEFALSILKQSILLGIVAWLISIISQLVAKTLEYGYRGYTLSVFRGQKASIGKLFCAFPRIHIILGCEIMVAIYTFLWSLLFGVAGAVLATLITVLLVDLLPPFVGGIMVVIVVLLALIFPAFICLRYALTPYVITEQRLGVFDSITQSKQLMRGNKWKLVFLRLSFLGWHILLGLIPSVLTGIGVGLGILCISTGSFVLGLIFIAVFVLLAIIAPIPLTLWLKGYYFTAHGGFYHTLSANSVPPVVQPPVMQPPVMQPPVVEAPVMEAPVMEAPVMEAPVMEAPVMEAPVMEAPVMEAPVMEAPVMEAPVMDAPVVDAPVMDAPVVDAPVVESPTPEAPVE